MKIREIFLLFTIYSGHTRRGNADKFFEENALSEQSQRLTNNASTHNIDKRATASKAVEVKNCTLCEYYDNYYCECMKDDECILNTAR